MTATDAGPQAGAGPSNPHWSHVALNCRDPQATEQYYSTHFGFRRVRRIPLGDDAIVFLRSGDAYLELFSADGGPAQAGDLGDGPHAAGGTRHIAFQTDDIDAFLARMGSAARVSLGPLDFSDFIAGWRSVWLLDPDDVVVEVSQGYRDQYDHDPQLDQIEEPADD